MNDDHVPPPSRLSVNDLPPAGLMRLLGFMPRVSAETLLDIDAEVRSTVSVYLALDFVQRLRNKVIVTEGYHWLPCSDSDPFVSYLMKYMRENDIRPDMTVATLNELVLSASVRRDGTRASDIYIPCLGNDYEWLATLFPRRRSTGSLVNAAAYVPSLVVRESDDPSTAAAAAEAAADDAVCLHFLFRVSSNFDKWIEDGTPAHVVAECGEVACLRFLHCMGADMRLCDVKGLPPAAFAAAFGHIECLEFLRIVDSNDFNRTFGAGNTLCYMAAAHGQLKCLKYVTNLGGNLHRPTRNLSTPLFAAACGGFVDCVDYLIRKGVDIHRANNDGFAPIHIAVMGGHNECAARLIRAGAKVNATVAHGWTPAHLACQRGHVDCLRTLVSAGANLTLCDQTSTRRLPLHLAAANGHVSCVAYLLEAGGCDPQARDAFGWTAARLAAKADHVDCVELLTEFIASGAAASTQCVDS